MADPRFHSLGGPFSLKVLADIGGARLHVDAQPDAIIQDVAPIDNAGQGQLTFLDNPRYLPAFEKSGAQACVVAPQFADRAPADMSLLLADNPYHVPILVDDLLFTALTTAPSQSAATSQSASTSQVPDASPVATSNTTATSATPTKGSKIRC